MPATAVARQICAAEMAKGIEEDYSVVIRLMEDLAGIGGHCAQGYQELSPKGGVSSKRAKMSAPDV